MILRKLSSFEPNRFIKVILYQDLCHLFLSMALNASSLRMGSFINCSILIFPLLVCGSSAQILVTLGVVLFSFNSFTPRMFGCGDLYLWHLFSSAVHLVLHLQHIVKLFLCQLPLSRMIEPMTKVKQGNYSLRRPPKLIITKNIHWPKMGYLHRFMCHQITVKSVTSLHPDLALVCMTHIPAFTPS